MPSPGKSQLSLGTVKCWEPAWFKNESQLVSTCYVINVWEVKVRLSPGIYTCAVVASCYQMESSFQLSSQCLQNGLFCKPMTYRCLLSTECPVYSPVTVRSEFWSRFNMSLALLLYPCIICLDWRQVLMPCQYWFASLSAQLLIADLTLLNETGNVSSGLGIGKELAARANWSALSFPGMPVSWHPGKNDWSGRS